MITIVDLMKVFGGVLIITMIVAGVVVLIRMFSDNYGLYKEQGEFLEAYHEYKEEVREEDPEYIGKVRDGLYHIGKGHYTGEVGWKIFVKEHNKDKEEWDQIEL